MNSAILLLHGLWVRPILLSSLASKLRQHAFQVFPAGYPSIRQSAANNAQIVHQQLQDFLHQHPDITTLHIVGHSLGGIVALHLLNQAKDLPSGRLVTLGSSVRGSLTAQRVQKLPVLRYGLGKSMPRGLSGEQVPLEPNRDWGMIAGTQPLGFGMLFGRFDEANDGTVTVAETRVPQLTDHVCLPVTHLSMLFSEDVIRQTERFLNNGQFLVDN